MGDTGRCLRMFYVDGCVRAANWSVWRWQQRESRAMTQGLIMDGTWKADGRPADRDDALWT